MGVPGCPVRASAVARPCSAVERRAGAACPAPRACGEHGAGAGAPCSGTVGSPRRGPWLGWLAAAIRACPCCRSTVWCRRARRPPGGLSAHRAGVVRGWGGLWRWPSRVRLVVALSGGDPPGFCWRQPVRRPPLPPSRGRRLSRAAEAHTARRAEPGGLRVDAGGNREDASGASHRAGGGGWPGVRKAWGQGARAGGARGRVGAEPGSGRAKGSPKPWE